MCLVIEYLIFYTYTYMQKKICFISATNTLHIIPCAFRTGCCNIFGKYVTKIVVSRQGGHTENGGREGAR